MAHRKPTHRELADRIKKLIFKISHWQWEVGDLAVEAVNTPDKSGASITLKDFWRTHLSDAGSYDYLSRIRNTSLAFPPPVRKKAIALGATWDECSKARELRNDRRRTGKASANDDMLPFVEEVLEQRPNSSFDKRSASKAQADKSRQAEIAARAGLVKKVRASNADYLNKMHNRNVLQVLPTLKHKSANLIWLDPPYSGYRKSTDGKFVMPTGSPFLTCSDSETTKEAIRITVNAISLSAPLLADKGAIVLWQPGLQPDRVEVLQGFKNAGLGAVMAMTWDKGRPQPGDFENPVSSQTERILIAARNWDSFYNTGHLPGRTDLLREEVLKKVFGKEAIVTERPPTREHHDRNRSKSEHRKAGKTHVFQKPRSICRYFLERLTLDGDLVIDAFGCAGTMCVEAIANNRQWLYVESNEENYNLGLANIRAELHAQGHLRDDGLGDPGEVIPF
jgi:16S rRNA G966 N2-methylase RsmD